MAATVRMEWDVPSTKGPYPVFGVLPVAPAKHHKLDFGDIQAQVEPWKVSFDGMIHSYRVGMIRQPEDPNGIELKVEGAPKSQLLTKGKFEHHPAVAELLAKGPEVELAIKHVSGTSLRAKALKIVPETDDSFAGNVEVVVQTAGSFKPNGGGPDDERTAFTALASAYSGVPWMMLEVIWHNGNWKQSVKADLLHQGLDLDLPDGYSYRVVGYDPNTFEAPSNFCHALPVMAPRLVKFLIWKDSEGEPDTSVAPQTRYFRVPQSNGDITKLAWDNPFCAGYLAQGLPVRFDPLRAKAKADKLRQDFLTGRAFDEMSLAAHGILGQCEFYAEGTPYGGAGSSIGVERFAEAGLAIHGHSGVLQTLQQLTLNRMPVWCMDAQGRHLESDDYAKNDAVPWRVFFRPSGRYTNHGQPNPENQFYGAQETFGYNQLDRSDFELAEKEGFECPYLEQVFGYGPYDRQHFKRALRATQPLAFICGDRIARMVLRQHAQMARAEHWEGGSVTGKSAAFQNRVGWMREVVLADPQRGMPGGREDAWAIECVLSALLLQRGGYAKHFKRWVASYATILRSAQMVLETSDGDPKIDRGLMMSDRSSKELNDFDRKFYIAQGYQDAMLGWAAHGIACLYGAPNLTTAVGQCIGAQELFGTPPSYKIAVEHIETGLICTSAAIQESFPFPKIEYTQIDHVPSLACCALTATWMDESLRGRVLDYLSGSLGLPEPKALLNYVPPTDGMEKQAACIAPMVEWLHQNALLT